MQLSEGSPGTKQVRTHTQIPCYNMNRSFGPV